LQCKHPTAGVVYTTDTKVICTSIGLLGGGKHSIQLTTSSYGASNPQSFQVQASDIKPTATISINPTLTLGYNSSKKESSLVALASVSVTAGTSDTKVVGKQYINLSDSSGGNLSLNSTQYSVTAISTLAKGVDQYGRDYYIVPAGTTGKFTFKRTDNPQQMFAGSYKAVVFGVLVLQDDAAKGDLQLPVPLLGSNVVTIVGELSPYLNQPGEKNPVGVKGSTLTFTGARLTGAMSIMIDNQIVSAGNLTLSGSSMSFIPPTTTNIGQHTLQVSNVNGASNSVWFSIGESATTKTVATLSQYAGALANIYAAIQTLAGQALGQ
jgi:hypothetical protein